MTLQYDFILSLILLNRKKFYLLNITLNKLKLKLSYVSLFIYFEPQVT